LKFSDEISSPFDACLREAASAKAGGRIKVEVDKDHSPPPLHPLPPREGRIRVVLSNIRNQFPN
jgi:hypothetical protein